VTPKARREIVVQLKDKKPRVLFAELKLGMDFSYEVEHPEEVKFIEEHYRFLEKVEFMNVLIRKEDAENGH
jgi:hypothetical protein